MITFLLFVLIMVAPAKAEFVGTLKLTPLGCEQQSECWLDSDFGFVDKRGVGWQADKGDKTDGASIPKWAQRFIGVPFKKEYLKAAVLHDHYSKSVRPVRGWFETQRMFHEVLLFSGVPRIQAAIMYAGVLIGSGKWIVRMKGKPCNVGEACINNVAELMLEREPESFDLEAYKKSFATVKKQIESRAEISEADVEALVISERPDSIFLKNPTGVIREQLNEWPWPVMDR